MACKPVYDAMLMLDNAIVLVPDKTYHMYLSDGVPQRPIYLGGRQPMPVQLRVGLVHDRQCLRTPVPAHGCVSARPCSRPRVPGSASGQVYNKTLLRGSNETWETRHSVTFIHFAGAGPSLQELCLVVHH